MATATESLGITNGPASPCWIGLFDILGFRELHGVLSGSDIAHIVQLPASYAHLIQTQPDEGGSLAYLAYADTILLYPRQINDEAAFLARLIQHSAYMLAMAASASIPMRGAVVKGEFLMSPAYVDAHQAFAGQQVWGEALISAHELERLQLWAGGVVDVGSASTESDDRGLALARERGFLVDYPIPLKPGRPGAQLEALNWPSGLGGDSGSHLRRIERLGPNGEGAAEKRANAAAFYRWSKGIAP